METFETTRDRSERIAHLASEVRRHRDLYYNRAPEISDEEFDALVERLEALAPDHPVLAEVGAPPAEAAVEPEAPVTRPERGRQLPPLPSAAEDVARWLLDACDRFYEGFIPTRADEELYEQAVIRLRDAAPDHPALGLVVPPSGFEWPKGRHEIPMGSLNKVNDAGELRAWAARCDELAAQMEGGVGPVSSDLAMTEKLDGISVEVLYEGGRIEAAITRGDGQIGERITPNVLRMKGVPHAIDLAGNVSVRGEIILRKSDAEAMRALRAALDPRFSGTLSLRNTAAGAARAKTKAFLPGCKLLSVLCYDIEGVEGLTHEREKLELLSRLGFATPPFSFGDAGAVIEAYDRYTEGGRDQVDYDIDGLVVRAGDLRAYALLGELNNRPRAAVAFKFGKEMGISRVDAIIWETGNTGRITPVALIAPVRLVGAEIRRVSLHNIGNVRRLGIGAGDEVLVSRRGDVIPYIEKVEVKGPNAEEAPEACAACGGPITVEGEYLVCRNLACPARGTGRLKTWINTLGLLEWGDKTIELLYERGLAREPADLYRLTTEDLVKIEGFGEKRASKLLEPLLANKQIPIATFVAALGIETVSKETAKLLVDAGYHTIEAMAAATVEELAAIPGLGAIKAEKIKSGLASRLDEVERLREVGVVPTRPAEGGPLAGLSFCFSGAHSRPRKVLTALVEQNGGTVRSSVTKGLDYLVLADPGSASSKAEKAKKLGTRVIGEPELDAIVLERGGKLD